jgi:hypothetical protein
MTKTSTPPTPHTAERPPTLAEATEAKTATEQAIATAEQTLADLRAVTGDRDNRLDRLLVQEELVDLAKQLEADNAECGAAGLREHQAQVDARADSVPAELADLALQDYDALVAFRAAAENLKATTARTASHRQMIASQCEGLVDNDRIRLNQTMGVQVDGVTVRQRVAGPIAGEVARAVSVIFRRADLGNLAGQLDGVARNALPMPRPQGVSA